MKPKYAWDYKHGYWRDTGKKREWGYRWDGKRWQQVWREPEADDPLCWFPEFAGQIVSWNMP